MHKIKKKKPYQLSKILKTIYYKIKYNNYKNKYNKNNNKIRNNYRYNNNSHNKINWLKTIINKKTRRYTVNKKHKTRI